MQSAGILTVSEIVRNDYRTADVFRKWGINYCCGGNLPLEEVCRLQKLDQVQVEADIIRAIQPFCFLNDLPFGEWSVDFLIDYIVYVHHEYTKRTLTALSQLLHSFIKGHKKKFQDLESIGRAFDTLQSELVDNMQKEEESIFPYLKRISFTFQRREVYGQLLVRTLGQSWNYTAEANGKRTTALLTELRHTTNHYQFAPSACTNHQVIYHKLKELDANLVQHQHLENDVLFPKVLSMEKELLQL